LAVESNVLAGTEPPRILWAAKMALSRSKNWANPFGDGKTAQKTMDILLNDLA
jgi:UDP-N-acetylglucosamine 2-epimerase (non-hydrolysing)